MSAKPDTFSRHPSHAVEHRCRAGSLPAKTSALTGRGVLNRRTIKPAKLRGARPSANRWQLRLYVTGQTTQSITALQNLKQFCDRHQRGRYRITVIDLVERPQLAKGDQIWAIPTVVRQLPRPMRMIIGNLSNTARLLVGLDLLPIAAPPLPA